MGRLQRWTALGPVWRNFAMAPLIRDEQLATQRNKTEPCARKSAARLGGRTMLMKWKIVAAVALLLSGPAFAAEEPGISATEIKIGGGFPFSGPASSIGLVGRGVIAYIQSVNDRGGINGRKINYITYDDAYSPPK